MSAVDVAENAEPAPLPETLGRANEVLRANGTLHEAARRAGLSPSRLSHVSRVCRASIGIAPSMFRRSELSIDPSFAAS